MREELSALLPLVCPACRTRDASGRHMHTLSTSSRSRGGTEGAVVEGTLVCDNRACGRTYPIVDGVPLVVPDLGAYLARDAAMVVEGDLAPATLARLAEPGPDDAPLPRLLDHLSVYLDAHWGDRAVPAASGPVAGFGMRALVEKVAERSRVAPVERAADLGCSVGRATVELARGAAIAVGVDLHFGALRRARRMSGGERVQFARRAVGRRYHEAFVRELEAPAANVLFACANALDPPLAPGAFQRVLALHLLDAVTVPEALLSVADGLLAVGGELILSCPYSFQSGIVDEDARFGGEDPAAWLRERLRSGEGLEARYRIDEDLTLPWSLRRDDRSGVVYDTHYLRVTKGADAASSSRTMT